MTPVPARQEGYYTRLLTDPQEADAWQTHMEEMEPSGIWFDKNGIAREVE